MKCRYVVLTSSSMANEGAPLVGQSPSLGTPRTTSPGAVMSAEAPPMRMHVRHMARRGSLTELNITSSVLTEFHPGEPAGRQTITLRYTQCSILGPPGQNQSHSRATVKSCECRNRLSPDRPFLSLSTPQGRQSPPGQGAVARYPQTRDVPTDTSRNLPTQSTSEDWRSSGSSVGGSVTKDVRQSVWAPSCAWSFVATLGSTYFSINENAAKRWLTMVGAYFGFVQCFRHL